jgi:putative integral membrane protein (TIGR02587 family)
MASTTSPTRSQRAAADRKFAIGLARAFGGAVIFGLPLLMTMEMWWLGFHMSPERLLALTLAAIPLLIGLSAVSGFEQTMRFRHDALDAFVAIAVGASVSAAMLALMGIVSTERSGSEISGMIILQVLPASMGALLAQSQFGAEDGRDKSLDARGYGGELFLMTVGALFLVFHIAPTEEIRLIAARMTNWHSAAMIVVSLVVMHAFVYALEFRGQVPIDPDTPFLSVFTRYTAAGYLVVVATVTFLLWVFGQLDGASDGELVARVVVLGLPGSIGAAAARLIL